MTMKMLKRREDVNENLTPHSGWTRKPVSDKVDLRRADVERFLFDNASIDCDVLESSRNYDVVIV